MRGFGVTGCTLNAGLLLSSMFGHLNRSVFGVDFASAWFVF